MSSYEMLKKASDSIQAHAVEVKLRIKTADPDFPGPLHWEIVLYIPPAWGDFAGDYVFGFLVNFNDLLLGVEVMDQVIGD